MKQSKVLQQRFNKQSRTAVWRRMAAGSLPVYKDGVCSRWGFSGRNVWAGVESTCIFWSLANLIELPDSTKLKRLLPI